MSRTVANATRPAATAGQAAAAGSTNPWQLTLDARIAAVCTALVTGSARRRDDGSWSPQTVLATTGSVLHERGLPSGTGRHPAGRQQIACYAAVYGRTFALSAPWSPSSGPAGLLRWTHRRTGRWLLDHPRAVHANTPLTTDLAQHAAATGSDDPLFLGVRLLPLAAPRAARLLLPGGQLTELPALHDSTPALALAIAL
jgi:hypothetical protein